MSGSGLSYEPYAFELSSKKIKFLSSNKITVLNSAKLNSYENFFHYIRLDQVLEHLDKPNEVLNTIKKLEKKNCIFFISVPNGLKSLIKKKYWLYKRDCSTLEHLNCFSKKV